MSQPPPSSELEHDVLTSDNVTSYQSNVKQADKALKSIQDKGRTNAQLLKVYTQLAEEREALLKRVGNLEAQVGKPLRTVRGMKELVADTKTYLKKVSEAAKKDYRTVYKFGKQKVADDSAMKSAIKGVKKLPDTAEKYIPQAVNDLWAGRGKATTKVGKGILHASAGKAAVKDNSCSIFFTREMDDGKETVTVVAVGSHATNNTYTIYWAGETPYKSKFPEGKVIAI